MGDFPMTSVYSLYTRPGQFDIKYLPKGLCAQHWKSLTI